METNNKIKTIIEKIKKNKILPYLIIMLFGILTTMPLFTMNLSEYNEFRIHIGRVTSVKEIIQNGVFPPFLSYKHMLDFGYALNIFYGSLTTYIPILISFFTSTNTMAIKIFTLLTVILSGYTMYRFVYKVTNKKIASLIAGLIYMAGPYKYTDIYSRNALGEYTAFIFIPMIFQGIYEVLNDEKKGNYLLIISASLLVITHTITTIYTAIFAILFLLFNYKKLKKWGLWKNLIVDVVFILLLTSFYTIPIIEHKLNGNYIIYDAECMRATGADVYAETNNPLDWFRGEISYRTQSPYDDLIFTFGFATTFLMIITIFCIKKINKKYKDIYGTFWILAIISLYLATKAFPWFIMPQFLTIIQFAWRLDGFFIFFIALVCGINAYEFSEILKSIKYTVITIIVSVIFIMGGLGVWKYYSKFEPEKDKKFETIMLEAEKIGPYNINRDYMPYKAGKNIDYLQKRENRTYVIKGKATIVSENKDKLNDKIEIAEVENATLELPYLYYMGYTVTINGNRTETYESEKGFLCINAKESGTIEVKYTGTTFEKIGFIISSLGLIIIISIPLLKTRKKQRKIVK